MGSKERLDLKTAAALWNVSTKPFHLFRYLDEEAFRFNEREGQDADRFKKALGSVAEWCLAHSELMGKTSPIYN